MAPPPKAGPPVTKDDGFSSRKIRKEDSMMRSKRPHHEDTRRSASRGYYEDGFRHREDKRSRMDDYYGPRSSRFDGPREGHGRFSHDGQRCREFVGRGRSRGRADSREQSDYRKALDNFGESINKLNNSSRKQVEDERKAMWPPCFQENGAAYVFDARSGFFYEAFSDFFYDPKTKLYYGNKTRLYYKYCEDRDPPFEEFHATESTDEAKADRSPLSSSPPAKCAAVDDNKAKIEISLKTKSLPGENEGASTKKSRTAPMDSKPAQPSKLQSQIQKRHEANMEVWSERGKERTAVTGGDVVDDTTGGDKVTKTVKGKPVCLICRRKFATLEKLQLHEKKSALHKENIAKMEAAEAKDRMQYRDRARERRVMYGPDSSLLSAVTPSDELPKAQVVNPEQNLGEDNVGNKMLKKLGWKSGHSLGRTQQESERSDRNIVKDWERIESLARSG